MKPGPQFDTLFHGTSAPLGPGDRVLPAETAGVTAPNSVYQGHRRFTEHDPYRNAAASSSEQHAWEFAGMTAQRVGGRAAVLKVDPAPDMKKGLEPKELISPTGFQVRDVEHIRPPEDIRVPNTFMKYAPNPRGRQGTLPIDWTPPDAPRGYSPYVAQKGDRFNHPTERDRKDEAARIEEQEAARQPEPPKPPLRRIKGQMELPGTRQRRAR